MPQTKSILTPFIVSIFGIVLIIIGIILEKHKTVYSKMGTGIVSNIAGLVPTPMWDRDQNGLPIGQPYTLWNGTILVQNINDPNKNDFLLFNVTNFRTALDVTPYSSVNGTNIIQIWINPNNPSDFKLSSDNFNIIGWILVGFGIVLTIIIWLTYLLRKKN